MGMGSSNLSADEQSSLSRPGENRLLRGRDTFDGCFFSVFKVNSNKPVEKAQGSCSTQNPSKHLGSSPEQTEVKLDKSGLKVGS